MTHENFDRAFARSEVVLAMIEFEGSNRAVPIQQVEGVNLHEPDLGSPA